MKKKQTTTQGKSKKEVLKEIQNNINIAKREKKNSENHLSLYRRQAEANKNTFQKENNELAAHKNNMSNLKSDLSKHTKTLTKLENEQSKLVNYNISKTANPQQVQKNKNRLSNIVPEIRHISKVVSQKVSLT